MNWTSMPMEWIARTGGPDTPDVHHDGAQNRDAERRGADRHEHDEQCGFARPFAGRLDRPFRDDVLVQRQRLPAGGEFLGGPRHGRYRPSAARTLPSASTTIGPRDLAHSSQ